MPPLFPGLLEAISAFLFAAGLAGLFALVRGYFHLRRPSHAPMSHDQNLLLKSPLVPALSLIAVVRDSSAESREFVRRLLQVHFGNFETVLVFDGLSEADVEVWKSEHRLSVSARKPLASLPHARLRCLYEPRDPNGLVVVNKEGGGGEADSLNAALNVARSPLIGIVEAACEFQPDAFLRLVRPILADPERTIAAWGTAPNFSRTGLAAQFGALESLRAWLGRCGLPDDGNPPAWVPGCCILAAREALFEAGGFQAGPLELLLRLHSDARAAGRPYRVAFVPEPVSHLRPAGTLRQLRALVFAEQRQIARALRSEGVPAPGLFSLFTSRVLRPLLETAAYALTAMGLALGWVTWDLAALVALSSMGMGLLQSMAAVVLREMAESETSGPAQLAGLFFASIPENLGYRPLQNLWLIAGLWGRAETAL
jgi:cellulose synthase/poly-beta-1,6-N-acetylglucosamine synthase-like glycosyltransferase